MLHCNHLLADNMVHVGLALSVVYFTFTFMYIYNRVEPNEALRDVCGYYQQYFEDYECHCMMEEQNG